MKEYLKEINQAREK